MTLVYGHGPVDGAGAPINVLASYPECRAAGVDGVELDLRLSGDGALVVIHDPELSDGRAVADTASADLPPDIPLLEQVLDATRGLVVNVEIKNYPRDPAWDPSQAMTDKLLELLEARSWSDDVIVSCFDVATIDRVRAVAPEVPTAMLYFSRRPAAELLEEVVDHGHAVVHPYDTMVDEVFMDTARDLSVAVNVWLADEAPEGRLGQTGGSGCGRPDHSAGHRREGGCDRGRGPTSLGQRLRRRRRRRRRSWRRRAGGAGCCAVSRP